MILSRLFGKPRRSIATCALEYRSKSRLLVMEPPLTRLMLELDRGSSPEKLAMRLSIKGAFGLSVRLAPPHAEGRSGFTVIDFDLDEFEDDQRALNLSLQSLETGSTGSVPSLELAQHWLRTCLDSHQLCGQSRDPGWYPSRLLHIDSGTDRVYLVETEQHQPTGPYATLSHCWGAHPIEVLAPDNIDDLKSVGRYVEELPQSFQDFIRINIFFGLSYVWIDSFCILQGNSPASVRDWERESLLMEQVYANGLLNVAAIFARDSRGGCFQERATLEGLPHRLRWCPISDERQPKSPRSSSARDIIDWVFDARSGMDQPLSLQAELSGLHNKQTFALSEYGSSSNILNSFGGHHLFTRAWVAQEQMLPSRMLHFGKEQIWWQCHEAALLSETFPCPRPVRLQADKSDPATALRPGVLE